jgi:hypothetical protein
MSTYATTADVTNYIEGYTVATGAETQALDRLIQRAERDVDSCVGFVPRDETTGRKFDPATLSVADRNALRDATCAQVEYRREMGPAFFVRPQHVEVKGPDFQTKGVLPFIGARVWQELEGSGLLRLTTSWRGARTRPPWADFAYNLPDTSDFEGPVR